MESERSFQQIQDSDLQAFAEIAESDRKSFFSRYNRKDNFLFSALCQGAAQHYVDKTNGVKDIDIWSFFAKEESVPDFPVRRRIEVDFGVSKFGVHPDDKARGFSGRRVDLLGRSIDLCSDESAINAVCRYLREGKTQTAWHLSKKPVVIVAPANLRGLVIWPQ